MINFTILFPYSSNKKFDMGYYIKNYIPKAALTADLLKNINVEQGISGGDPHTQPAFFCITQLTFDSIKDLNRFLLHSNELKGDISNFTDVDPIIQVSEIKN